MNDNVSNNRALLVEDSKLFFDSMKPVLEKAGWETIRANDPDDAFFRIEQAQKEEKFFDLIATDLGLPPSPDTPDSGLL